MPIYEYHCARCGDFDLMRKITEKPLRRCPTCKGPISKLMSSTAFQLKGTGWYVTDYAAKAKGSADDATSDGTAAEKTTSADSSTPSTDSGSAEKSAKPEAAKSEKTKIKGGKGSKPEATAAA